MAHERFESNLFEVSIYMLTSKINTIEKKMPNYFSF